MTATIPKNVATAAAQFRSQIGVSPISTFDAFTGMTAVTLPIGLNAIRVNGHSVAGDGGDGLYVKASAEPTNINKFLGTYSDGSTSWFQLDCQADVIPWTAYGFAGSDARTGFLKKVVASSETGPEFSGSFQLIANGGHTSTSANYKVALTAVYSGLPGAGDGWAANFVASSQPGMAPQTGLIGLEIDVNNSHITSNGLDGTPYTAGLYISGGGTGRNDAAIVIAGSSNLWYDGIRSEDVTGAGNRLIEGSFLNDQSKSRNVLLAGNTHTVGINMAGATFTQAAIQTPGFSVGPTGGVATPSINVSGVLVRALAAAVSGGAGIAGEYRHDDSFIYVCVATNTWKRVALSAF